MTARATPPQKQGSSPREVASGLRYVARQPILDRHGRVHGYELLFRDGPEQVFRGDGDLATQTMFDNTILFGIEQLTGSLPAFVNCTEEALTGPLVHILPSGMTVLEILETVEPTPSLMDACRKLKAAGFRLALDDFVWKPEYEPLIALSDYIKIDFIAMSAAERADLVRRLHGSPVCLIAEKVETQADFETAQKEGFRLFQGYYFCRPVLMKSRKIPPNRLLQIEILRFLQNDEFDMRRLSQLVMRDAALIDRLLRMVNSPVFAVRTEVISVESALMAVGEDSFRRMAALAIASEINAEQPPELLRMAFVRARFCELGAKVCGLDANEQYLVGLLSLFPVMLKTGMNELVGSLPLRKEICEALLGTENRERLLIQWIERYELGDWAACDAVLPLLALTQDQAVRCYSQALEWAEKALHFSR